MPFPTFSLKNDKVMERVVKMNDRIIEYTNPRSAE